MYIYMNCVFSSGGLPCNRVVTTFDFTKTAVTQITGAVTTLEGMATKIIQEQEEDLL
jgi:hypothetical protein